MIIFIDSNIFFNKWTLDDIHFQLLFNYLSISKSELLISELVCQEVDNLYLKTWKESLTKARSHLKSLVEISPKSVSIQLPEEPERFSLKQVLKEKAGYNSVKFFSYDDIPQTEVVRRAIHRIRPFQDEDKGYRDTLIWLSFLTCLKTTNSFNVKEICFISYNNGDFYENTGKNTEEKGEIKFHPSLLNDINDYLIKAPIKPYLSLASFIKSNVAKDQYEFSYYEFANKFIYPIESEVEAQITDVINEMKPAELEGKANNWHRNSPIRGFIFTQSFEIFEGVEDLEVIGYKRINDETYYVNLSFNLRRCSLTYSIDSNEYVLNKIYIDRNYDDVEYSPEETLVKLYFRPNFEISIKLIVPNVIQDLAIDRLEFH
jgi:hypothetical protein